MQALASIEISCLIMPTLRLDARQASAADTASR
jgi:hypothetical protein